VNCRSGRRKGVATDRFVTRSLGSRVLLSGLRAVAFSFAAVRRSRLLAPIPIGSRGRYCGHGKCYHSVRAGLSTDRLRTGPGSRFHKHRGSGPSLLRRAMATDKFVTRSFGNRVLLFGLRAVRFLRPRGCTPVPIFLPGRSGPSVLTAVLGWGRRADFHTHVPRRA
jgi:hypothetical protein